MPRPIRSTSLPPLPETGTPPREIDRAHVLPTTPQVSYSGDLSDSDSEQSYSPYGSMASLASTSASSSPSLSRRSSRSLPSSGRSSPQATAPIKTSLTDLGSFIVLDTLDLQRSGLESMPAGGFPATLKTAILSYNKLKTLPHLPLTLERLVVDNNPLEDLPRHPDSLITLNIRNTPFAQKLLIWIQLYAVPTWSECALNPICTRFVLDEVLFRIDALAKLFFRAVGLSAPKGSTLAQYPDVYMDGPLSILNVASREMKNIKELTLKGESFVTLPGQVAYFSGLTSLSLTQCGLRALCSPLPFPRLEDLNLGDNKLTQLSLVGLPKLKRVVLQRNRLKTFPDGMMDLPRLQEVDLTGNRIATVPLGLRNPVLKLDGQPEAFREWLYSQISKATLKPNTLSDAAGKMYQSLDPQLFTQ